MEPPLKELPKESFPMGQHVKITLLRMLSHIAWDNILINRFKFMLSQ